MNRRDRREREAYYTICSEAPNMLLLITDQAHLHAVYSQSIYCERVLEYLSCNRAAIVPDDGTVRGMEGQVWEVSRCRTALGLKEEV